MARPLRCQYTCTYNIVLPQFNDLEFLLCFKAWAKLVQQWLVFMPNKKLFELVVSHMSLSWFQNSSDNHSLDYIKTMSGMTLHYISSQVAQFLLDDAIMSGCGTKCHVICTQPRRISAISGSYMILLPQSTQSCFFSCWEGGIRKGGVVRFLCWLSNTFGTKVTKIQWFHFVLYHWGDGETTNWWSVSVTCVLLCTVCGCGCSETTDWWPVCYCVQCVCGCVYSETTDWWPVSVTCVLLCTVCVWVCV